MELLFNDIIEQINALEGVELYCFYASQIIGLLATLLGIVTGQLNKAKHILIKEVVLNSMCGIAALLVSGYNGAVVALLASALAAVIYYYDKRSLETPKWVYISSYVVFLAAGIVTFALWSGRNWYEVFPIISSMIFVYSLTARDPRVYRLSFLVNGSLWIIYYFKITAYSNIFTQFFLLVSIVIATIRYDMPALLKMRKKTDPEQ